MVGVIVGLVLLVGPVDLPEDLPPGDGIGLAPNPISRPGVASTDHDRNGNGSSSPIGYPALPVAGVATVAALGVGVRRRREDPIVVTVHGHGGSAADFDLLISRLGIPRHRVVAFDYSMADPSITSTEASRRMPTPVAAAALDTLIRELSEDNANIYSIHHSRGGAVGAEMIADLDMGIRPPIDGYRGAALLDPAISRGLLGRLQSHGTHWGTEFIPSDGGFDPIRCSATDCVDIREGLGTQAGVEVLAIRNTDAVLPSFHDEPPGLRVLDVPDRKVSAVLYGMFFAPWFFSRSREAHASVLVNEAVADCIANEIVDPGSCTGLKNVPPSYVPARGSGASAGRNRTL